MDKEKYQEVLDDVVTRGQRLVHKMTTQVVVEGSDKSIEIVECSGDSDSAKLEAIIHFGEFVMKANQDNFPKSGVSRSIGFK